MPSRALGTAALLASLALARDCYYPRDPSGTLERVRSGTMRVGIIERPPWTIPTGGEPRGAEVDLVRGFAHDVGAKEIAWVAGSEDDLLGALERHDLDLVIGGITEDDPWTKRIAPSRTYYTERMCVGTTVHEPHFEPKGRRITTHEGEPLAAILAKKGALVARVPIVEREDAPVGAPEWQIRAWGLHVATCVTERKHVIAAAPGENAFVLRLDRALTERRHEVPRSLERLLAKRDADEQKGAARR